jgi:hypothetical protein
MRQNLLEMSLVPIVPATPVEKTTKDAVKFCWSKGASTALLEEVINSGAHRPPYGQVERLWKEVPRYLQTSRSSQQRTSLLLGWRMKRRMR